MLDIKFIRENPDIVKENIKKKFQDEKLPLVDEVIELDSQRRANIQEADQLRSDRNRLSKQVGMLMGQAKKDPSKLEDREVTLGRNDESFIEVLSGLEEGETVFIQNVEYLLGNAELDEVGVGAYECLLECPVLRFYSDVGDCPCAMIRCLVEYKSVRHDKFSFLRGDSYI